MQNKNIQYVPGKHTNNACWPFCLCLEPGDCPGTCTVAGMQLQLQSKDAVCIMEMAYLQGEVPVSR